MYQFYTSIRQIIKLNQQAQNVTKNRVNFNKIQQQFQYYSTQTTNLQLPGLNSDVNVENLTKNDAELLKKLQIIILEVDVMRQEGLKVPDSNFLKEQHWNELLFKTSRSQRKKYLEFLWKVEKKKENIKIKKENDKIQRENRPPMEENNHITYGLNHNTFFIRIYDTTINHMYNNRLINAHIYGQPLVIDVGYDKSMTSRECQNCAKQIMLAFSENRNHEEPFDLHLCNAEKNSPTISALYRHIGTLFEPWFPLSVHGESYLTAKFPSIDIERQNEGKPAENAQDRLKSIVYLTPHCREEMKNFDHNAVYIIGGIVDKINQEPLSLAKAKSEGLKMQKLPLDRYLSWGSGSGKSLTINQMVSILLDLRRTGNWDFALRHVPRRKVLGQEPANVNKFVEKRSLPYDKNRNYRYGNKSKSSDFIKELLKN